ncbi:MAG: phosphotransferase [Syntrophobacterales bacterium]|jgi:hypothetical protein
MDSGASFPRTLAEKLIRENTEMSGPFSWQPLQGDGSERTFYRVASQKDSLVLVWSPLDDPSFPNENDSYVYMGRHLYERGIPVPKIYGYWRTEGLTLVEDLGSVHLQDVVRSDEGKIPSLYRRAVDLLLELQLRATHDLDTSYCFDTVAYDQQFIINRELEYFRQSFLVGALGLEVDFALVEPEFSLLALRASEGEGRLFFLHRDFQSRNLMLKEELLYLIDFQGARLGPPQYDLAALLLDPYVQLTESLQKELLLIYSKNFSDLVGISVNDFLERYPHVALCRQLQVLAAFAFLAKVKGRVHFAQYIVPAWKRLRRLLAETTCSAYRVLAGLVQSQSDEKVAQVSAELERKALRAAGKRQPPESSRETGET